VPLEKQLKMMETILYLYDKCTALVAKQVPVSQLLKATGLFDKLVQDQVRRAQRQAVHAGRLHGRDRPKARRSCPLKEG
jgi:vacuolar-type H+-ATPase catalytic subunit A/Vma1